MKIFVANGNVSHDGSHDDADADDDDDDGLAEHW